MSNPTVIDYATLEPMAISYFEKKNGGNNSGNHWAQHMNKRVDEFISEYSKKFKIDRKDVVKVYLTRMTTATGEGLNANHFASAMLAITQQPEETQIIPQKQIKQQYESLNLQVQKLSKSLIEQQTKQNDLEQAVSAINKAKQEQHDEPLELNVKSIVNHLTRKAKTLFNSFDSFTTKYVIISILLFTVLLLMSISNNSFTSFISLALIMCVLNITTQFKPTETKSQSEEEDDEGSD